MDTGFPGPRELGKVGSEEDGVASLLFRVAFSRVVLGSRVLVSRSSLL